MALFPAAMGLAAGGDANLVRRAHRAVAEQLSAMGVTTIHSPVLDINVNPTNPEIGVRAFGDEPESATRYALAAMRGLQDGGLIPTGKHFPGRGDSAVDAHHDVPVIDADRARLDAVELYPYRELIAGGLDSIMLAHTVYPALDPDNLATVSRRIVTGLLREELGFDGVITTDAIAMGALVERHTLPTACALALAAGADMVLNKMETTYRDQGFLETLRFVREGRISEAALDDKVRRILRMKYRRGLFASSQVDPSAADRRVGNPDAVAVAEEAARAACLVLRNRGGILPLSPGQRIGVVEQSINTRNLPNTAAHHRLSFTEAMYGHSMNTVAADTALVASDGERDFVLSAMAGVDTVVMTNYYGRSVGSNSALAEAFIRQGKRVILVTNTPFPMSVVKGAAAIVCTFTSNAASLRVAADILYGKAEPGGVWPLAAPNTIADSSPASAAGSIRRSTQVRKGSSEAFRP
jgi:beta-N-acetylhexosaminidase